MPRPKRQPPEPLDCEPTTLAELESVVKQVLSTDRPEIQRSENREPTQEELNQKFKLKRRN